MADLKKSIEIIFEGNDQASRKAADVIGKIREMEAAGKAAALESDKLAGGLESIGKKEAIIAAAGAALKALAAGLVFDRFIETNVAIEKFERGLKAVLGASTDTGAELAYVTGVADKLGIQLLVATDAYVGLSAATKGTVLQGQQTRDIFEAVSKAMSALGRSSTDTEGAFRAIEQIASKGKVQMEELRGQLGDRLPGALQIAARAMGVTTEELDSLVKKGVSAEDFLPRFAAELNKTFAGASFEGYVQSMARLRNAVDTAFIDIGKAGAFDVIIAGVNAITATFTGSISAIRLFGETWANIAYTVSTGDFSGFAGRFEDSLNKAASSTKSLLDALGLGEDAAKKVGTSGAKAGADVAAGMDAASKAAAEAARQGAVVDKQLKELGINPDKIKKPLDDLIATFEAMAMNPAVKGDQILAGLKAVLKDVKDSDAIGRLSADIVTANAKGSLSAKEFAEATKLLDDAQGKLDGTVKKSKDSLDEQAKAIARQAAETKKAEENAQKFALEMEKLASNERIKNIEAKVRLNIAELEAQTKQVEAAFASINETVGSTGDLLGSLFGLFKDYDNLSFGAIREIKGQIELENTRRQQALDLQKKLIEAQVAQLRAQTRALEKGDSIIKVDGAGLQPHLEAFMWEILRTIQVRVNQDGLQMLLGQ